MTSAPARTFRRAVRRVLERAADQPEASVVFDNLRAGAWWGLYLEVYVETPRRRDLDNVLKPTVDAVAFALGITDSGLVDVHLSKHLDPLDPHIQATIVVLCDWAIDRREYRVIV